MEKTYYVAYSDSKGNGWIEISDNRPVTIKVLKEWMRLIFIENGGGRGEPIIMNWDEVADE